MERKIGEIFNYKGRTLKVVESDGHCHGLHNREMECFFNHGLSCKVKDRGCCGNCSKLHRSLNNNSVCFVEITNEEKNMEEKLDLTKILKIGDKVWSPLMGECIVKSSGENTSDYTIIVKTFDGKYDVTFTKEGKYFDFSHETTLFPSKDHRVWDDEAIMIIRPPKKGDYLISEMGNPFIYNGVRKYGKYGAIVGKVGGDISFCCKDSDDNFTSGIPRYATSEEIKEFDEFLKSKGYYFDKEKLELKKLRWRAKNGEIYWLIDSCGAIYGEAELNAISDNKRYELGNYFKTSEEATKALKQIKELLNNYSNGDN